MRSHARSSFPNRRGSNGLITALLVSALAFTAAPAAQSVPLDDASDPADEAQSDRLAVSVVGDGAAVGNEAVPVRIQEYSSEGELVDAVELPTSSSGESVPFALGADRDQQGALQQSADHQLVTLGGFAAEPGWVGQDGETSLNGSSSEEVTRTVAAVDAAGSVDTSTGLAGAYETRHIRGAATVDGGEFWTGGHGNDTEGPQRGGVQHVTLGAETPTPVTANGGQVNNVRVPVIHEDTLYVSSDRDDYDGVSEVGAGLPTSEAEMTLVASAPAGRATAHDFAFIGDHLYVAYTEESPAIVRYDQDASGSWRPAEAVEGEFWGLTGREAGDDVVLYAVRGSAQGNELVTILDPEPGAVERDDTEAEVRTVAYAPAGHAFRGVAFAPGFVPGDEPVELGDAAAGISWDTRIAHGSGNALSAVVGAETNPEATGRITVPEGDADALQGASAEVTSSNSEVVAGEDVAVEWDGEGGFTLTATPRAAGIAVLTLTAELPDGRTASGQLHYWASEELADETALGHVGLADASSAQDAGDGHFFVADDDTNEIRLYGPTFGEPVAEFSIGDMVDPVQSGQTWDLESSARIGDVIFWNGSFGNTRSGNVRLDRDVVVATRVSGSGAEAELEPLDYTRGIREALVQWDVSDAHGLGAHAFGFERATQDGYSAEGPDSLNVEGAAIAPDGTTMWLGFRSPLVKGEALIVEVPEIEDVVLGEAEARIGEHMTLDLGGRAIRGMTEAQDGGYLIQAGSADDAGQFALFGWSGDPAEAPVQSQNPLDLQGWEGSYESLPLVPDLQDGTTIRVIQDVGTVDIYDTGTEAQDLTREHMKFVSHEYELDFGGAFSAAPENEPESVPDREAGAGEEPHPTPPASPESGGEPPLDEAAAKGVPDEAGQSEPAQEEVSGRDQTAPEAGDEGSLAQTGLGWFFLGLGLAALVLLALGAVLIHRARSRA